MQTQFSVLISQPCIVICCCCCVCVFFVFVFFCFFKDTIDFTQMNGVTHSESGIDETNVLGYINSRHSAHAGWPSVLANVQEVLHPQHSPSVEIGQTDRQTHTHTHTHTHSLSLSLSLTHTHTRARAPQHHTHTHAPNTTHTHAPNTTHTHTHTHTHAPTPHPSPSNTMSVCTYYQNSAQVSK